MDTTLKYYDENAESFASGTIDAGFSEVHNKFIGYLPQDSYILDFGCGAGRDTKFFLEKGLRVDAIDGSEKLCEIASRNTGIAVKRMLFSELEDIDKYDGIWACASILHLKKEELKDVIKKMIRAVKPGGLIYTSFKYGQFEGYRNDRFFTDFTEESFHEFIKEFSGILITEEWISSDVRPGRGNEKWLNLILKRSDTV